MNESSGILVLDKAAGISSAKAIAQVKYKFGLKKIGHAGTLDPAATGILICLVNNATKSAKIFEGGKKTYAGTIKLGIATTTDDLEGEVISHADEIPSFDKVSKASKQFVGVIEQLPPVVSAVKVNGIRSYDMFRKKGVALELKPRSVTVESFQVHATDMPDIISYVIACTSGTYIRSLARDLGAVLGCGACVATLRRIYSEPFSENDAKKIEDITMSDLKQMEINTALCLR